MERKLQQNRLKTKFAASNSEASEQYVRQLADTRKLVREFHDSLTGDSILKCWDLFRDSETQKDGLITCKEYQAIMGRVFPPKFAPVVDLLFTRFSPDPGQKIAIHEVLVSLAVLLKADQRSRVLLLLKLMDVDEDNCLSILEIKTLFHVLEDKFIMFTSNFQSQSRWDLYRLAATVAQHKFGYFLNYKYDEGYEDKQLSQILMSYQEFMKILDSKASFARDFLPNCLPLMNFLAFQYKHSHQGATARYHEAFENFQEQINRRINHALFGDQVFQGPSRGEFDSKTNLSVSGETCQVGPFGQTGQPVGNRKALKWKSDSKNDVSLPPVKKPGGRLNSQFKPHRSDGVVKDPREQKENPNDQGVKYTTFEEKQKMIKVLKIPVLIPNHIPISKIIHSL